MYYLEEYQFTAKEYDEETGLYYMSARYMNPKTSMWASSDPAGWELINPMEKDNDGKFQQRQGFSIIESTNPYSYCSNQPSMFKDPTGKDDIFFQIEYDFVIGDYGGEIATGAFLDTENLGQSGVYSMESTESGGINVGLGIGVGWVLNDIEGESFSIDFDLKAFSLQIFFSDEGLNGVGLSIGPGVGSSGAITDTKACTLEDLAKVLINGVYDAYGIKF